MNECECLFLVQSTVGLALPLNTSSMLPPYPPGPQDHHLTSNESIVLIEPRRWFRYAEMMQLFSTAQSSAQDFDSEDCQISCANTLFRYSLPPPPPPPSHPVPHAHSLFGFSPALALPLVSMGMARPAMESTGSLTHCATPTVLLPAYRNW